MYLIAKGIVWGERAKNRDERKKRFVSSGDCQHLRRHQALEFEESKYNE